MSALTGLSGLSGYVGGGGGVAGPVYQDACTRANSATVLGTPTVGGPYVAAYGTWGISSNKAYCVTDVDGNAAVVDTGLVNGTFLATVQGGLAASNYRDPSLVVRYLDLNNFLWVVVQAGQVALQKVDAGAFTWLNGGTTPTPDATDIRLRVTCQGAVVTVYCDDVLRFSHTLSGAETTKYTGAGYTRFGMRLGKGGTPTVAARWDDLAAYAAVLVP